MHVSVFEPVDVILDSFQLISFLLFSKDLQFLSECRSEPKGGKFSRHRLFNNAFVWSIAYLPRFYRCIYH